MIIITVNAEQRICPLDSQLGPDCFQDKLFASDTKHILSSFLKEVGKIRSSNLHFDKKKLFHGEERVRCHAIRMALCRPQSYMCRNPKQRKRPV